MRYVIATMHFGRAGGAEKERYTKRIVWNYR